MHLHPANQARHDDRTLGQRVADSVSGAFGSWRFIIVQTTVLLLWVVLNSVAWFWHWDIYPFVFMNLIMSLQSAYAAPLILLAQNRQEEHDRVKAEHDYEVNQESLNLLRKISSGEVALRVAQTAIVEGVTEIVESLRED